MSYMDDYSQAMDFIREKLDLSPTVSLYEAVVKMVSEYKRIEETLKSQKEKRNVGRKKSKSGTRGNQPAGT